MEHCVYLSRLDLTSTNRSALSNLELATEMEKVTIGVVNFNGKYVLIDTLRSVQGLEYPIFEVIVVDNNSTDGSLELAKEQFPKFHCIRLNSNIGPAGARSVILKQAKTDYVFMMDNDIVLEPDVMNRLLQVMKKVPDAAVCHPEIRDTNDPLAYHYNGGWIHYLCAFLSRPEKTEEPLDYEIFDVVSGAALLVDRNKALKIGGIDEDFFFNWEDGDFTSRFTLAGYLCFNVPGAVVNHRSKRRGTSKVFYQVRNRWFFILKLYSWRTLILAAPMFFLFELSQALFLIAKGAMKDYFAGSFAAFYQLPSVLRKRRAFQKLKVKKDRDWLRDGDFYLPEGLLRGKTLRILKRAYCGFFNVYWRIIKPLC